MVFTTTKAIIAALKCWFGFHQWGDWKVGINIGMPIADLSRSRICVQCGQWDQLEYQLADGPWWRPKY